MIKVVFARERLKKEFEALKYGNGSERMLHRHINMAIRNIKQNPACGIRIKNNNTPHLYRQYDNIFKYDLPRGWRLIYSISRKDIEIFAIIIEWFDHNNYEKRFNYLLSMPVACVVSA